jgi:hypothetical protein
VVKIDVKIYKYDITRCIWERVCTILRVEE